MRIETENERIAFSSRLASAMEKIGCKASPTQLSREFNARSTESITIHAARKWLVGDAIPTQAKVRVLAQWLGVTAEWLRYGEGESSAKIPAVPLDSFSVSLIVDIKRLSAKQQKLARDFVSLLVRQEASA